MSELTPEARRIHELVGALSVAFWNEMKRGEGEPDFSLVACLLERGEGECRPRTEEEAAIWEELTCPRNHDALLSYIRFWGPRLGINDYAARLQATLLAQAKDRRNRDAAGGA
jgi:hypothetical protein